MHERTRGFTLIEVMIAIFLVASIGVVLLKGVSNADSGQQAASARQASSFLFDYLSSQVTGGNPSYTPPNSGDTVTLSSGDIASIFADRLGMTMGNTQLFSARITNVREVTQDVGGSQMKAIEYLIKVCWTPISQPNGRDESSCIEKSVTGPVPSRYAGGNAAAGGGSTSIPVGSGKLVINITTPNGVDGDVLVSGPGLTRRLTHSEVLNDLAPGNYSVTPNGVSDSLYTYVPTMSNNAGSIGAGEGAVVDVVYTADSGALSLSVTHPAGVTPNVTVSSSDASYSNTVHGSTTLNYLSPGSYTISADPVTAGSYTYAPTIDNPTVNVSPGATSSAVVSYGPTTGALKITVDAPTEVTSATVKIVGPNNYQNTVGLGENTIDNLPEGTYLALPEDVVLQGVTYSGSSTPAGGAYVSPGSTAALSVSYSASTAALNVHVTASPNNSSIEPVVHVSGPNGQSSDIRGVGDHLLSGIQPGHYDLKADPASDGTFTWTAMPNQASFDLSVGDSRDASFNYAVRSGVLKLNVTGLPANAGAPVHVTGPTDNYAFGQGTNSVNPAPPGNYQLSAEPVDSGYFTYSASPASLRFAINAGEIVTKNVTYAANTGAISLASSGLPQGQKAKYTLSGPAGSRQLEGDQVVGRLIPGDYTVTAAAIEDGYARYTPTPATLRVSVSGGQVSDASFNYAVQPAAINVDVRAPANSAPHVTISGPSGPYEINTPGISGITNVTPGRYAVAADPLTYDHRRYVPSHPDYVEARSGQTAQLVVTYSPTTAAIRVTINAPGNMGKVIVSGPNGYSATVDSTRVLDGLLPGRYALEPVEYTYQEDRYTATGQTIDLQPGDYSFARFDFTRATGHIEVKATGLPAGAAATATIRAPGYTKTVTMPELVRGLAPGRYHVTADSVRANGYTYAPHPDSYDVSISAGGDAEADFDYEPSSGVIRLQVSAPDSLSWQVRLGSDSGENLERQGTGDDNHVFADVSTGRYTVRAPTVTINHIAYAPTIDPATFTLAGAETKTVRVRYAPSTATLKVNVNGVPSGHDARIHVTGPGGYQQDVTETVLLEGLEPGTYALTADAVTEGAATYEPSPASSSVDLEAGDGKEVSFTYTVVPAQLRLTVSGLPSGTPADVTLSNDDGFSDTVTGSHTWTDLAPGDYDIDANDVVAGSFVYHPNPSSSQVTARSGTTATATVTYSTPNGQLNIRVGGNQNAPYHLSGPNGYSHEFRGSQSLMLDPGDYSLTMPDYHASNGHTYKSDQPSLRVTVVAGQSVDVSFTYYRYTATIAVSSNGLPVGSEGSYAFGAGSSQRDYATPHTHIVSPGTYSINPHPVTVGNIEYRAPAFNVVAEAGRDYNEKLSYHRYTATLNVSASGLPAGVTPRIRVTGTGVSQTKSGASVTFYLPPGRYQVEGLEVNSGGAVYRSNAQSVDLAEGGNESVSLTYSQYNARLTVRVSGAPRTPTVTLSKPGWSSSKTGTVVTFYAPPGSYRVTGNTIASSGFYYAPPPVSTSLASGDDKSVRLQYRITTGKARVYDTGSRSGYPNVTLKGPHSYSSAIGAGSNPTYRNYLTPGTYTLAYSTPYQISSTRRFVARNAVNSASVTAGHVSTLKVYWQYQEYVCTSYFIVCWSYGWVDK